MLPIERKKNNEMQNDKNNDRKGTNLQEIYKRDEERKEKEEEMWE